MENQNLRLKFKIKIEDRFFFRNFYILNFHFITIFARILLELPLTH